MKALRRWWRADYHRYEQGLTADATVGRPGASFIRFLQVTSKGKVFPYSLPSVGPGADPGVQAVSPQVT